MNKVLLLTFSCFLSLAVSDAAPQHHIHAGQTGVMVSTEHSMAQCTRIAHQTCNQVFGKCQKYDGGAASNELGYLVLYECHRVKMTIGGVTVLVIAGSGTEGTSKEKLAGWMTKSYNLANSSFR